MNTQLNELKRLLDAVDSCMSSAEVQLLIRDSRKDIEHGRRSIAKAIKIVGELDAQQVDGVLLSGLSAFGKLPPCSDVEQTCVPLPNQAIALISAADHFAERAKGPSPGWITLSAVATELRAMAASTSGAQPGRVSDRLELTDELKNILGRPNFTCTPIAEALRRMGFVIDRKSEAEQATCLHWMLNHYLAHGADWKVHAEAELKAGAPAQGGAEHD